MDEFALCQTRTMLYAIDSVRKIIDQKPPGLPRPGELSLEKITKECSFEESAQPSTRPAEKRRRLRCSKRPVFKRRRRVAALTLLVILTVGSILFLTNTGRIESKLLEHVVTPPMESEAPGAIPEDASAKEEVTEEASKEEPSGEEVTAVPDDPTLYLTVPRLGLYEHTVRNDDSEAALDLGAVKLPQTDFPWQKGANTYIACHRLGWPGSESHNQCLNLPSMQQGDEVILKDANGTSYKYRVVETLIVGPSDTWVTDPVAGKDIVSLQTCIEAPDDLYTLGPNWAARFVVRAQRTEEEQAGSLQRFVGESVTAYAGLLDTPSFSYFGSVLRTAKKAIWSL
jgi:sortase A